MNKQYGDRLAWVALVIGTLIIAASIWYRSGTPDMGMVSTTINNQTFDLYTPRTLSEQQVGLAAFDSLDANQGMIFRGLPAGIQSFWMKNMQFDIDILWINKDNMIVHIEEYISRDSYPQVFKNPADMPSSYVIELVAGTVRRSGISLGMQVTVRNSH